MSGFVYIFEVPKLHCIKVGYSGSYAGVESRLRTTQTHSPADVSLLTVLPGSVKSEQWLHRKLAKGHIRGEWFVRSPEVIKAAQLVNELTSQFHPKSHNWKPIFTALKIGAKRWKPYRWQRRFNQSEKLTCQKPVSLK